METLLRRHALATQHNFLIHAPLDLSHVEARIFALALACIHKNDEELPPISMCFTDVFETTSGSNYASLAKAIDSLVGKRVRLESITSKKKIVEVYNIIAFLKLDTETGLINGEFSHLIAPYLLMLRNNFTSMEVETLLTMKSAHTMRLAWFLKAHEYQKGVEIDLVKLRKMLFGEEPGYADFFEFKRRVLKPVMAELNDKNGVNWQVDVEEIRKGLRQVIGLRFTIPKMPSELTKVTSAKKERKPKSEVASLKPVAAETAPAPLMHVNKEEPAPLAQVMQAATAQLASPQPPAANTLAQRVSSRLDALKLTQAQIKKVLSLLEDNEECLTKLMKETHPVFCDFRDGRVKHDEVAGKTVNKLKSLFPAVNKAWSKE